MIRALLLRYHRWRVWREPAGSPARKRAVRAYLAWCHRWGPRTDPVMTPIEAREALRCMAYTTRGDRCRMWGR